jgi:hypothetical protein
MSIQEHVIYYSRSLLDRSVSPLSGNVTIGGEETSRAKKQVDNVLEAVIGRGGGYC